MRYIRKSNLKDIQPTANRSESIGYRTRIKEMIVDDSFIDLFESMDNFVDIVENLKERERETLSILQNRASIADRQQLSSYLNRYMIPLSKYLVDLVKRVR